MLHHHHLGNARVKSCLVASWGVGFGLGFEELWSEGGDVWVDRPKGA